MPDPLAPGAVRGLIADIRTAQAWLVTDRHSAVADALAPVAAALEASLPREDADLETAREEALVARYGNGHNSLERAANRHGFRHGFTEGVAWALDSRTVETAEEWEPHLARWEYGYRSPNGGGPSPCDEEFASHRRRPARPAGPWESMPPTHEEGTTDLRLVAAEFLRRPVTTRRQIAHTLGVFEEGSSDPETLRRVRERGLIPQLRDALFGKSAPAPEEEEPNHD